MIFLSGMGRGKVLGSLDKSWGLSLKGSLKKSLDTPSGLENTDSLGAKMYQGGEVEVQSPWALPWAVCERTKVLMRVSVVCVYRERA